MELEDALRFVRRTDSETWNLLVREMNLTRKRRDEESAKHFAVGEMVCFEPPPPARPLKGHIIKIGRGRFTLAVPSEQSGFLERVGVPASMIRRCS
jgi:hypothetical protein